MTDDTDARLAGRLDRRTVLRSLAGGTAASLTVLGSVSAGLSESEGPPDAPGRPDDAGPPAEAEPRDPPTNDYLASDLWGATHRNAYAQASSPYPALTAADTIEHNHNLLAPGRNIPITLTFTDTYDDGTRAMWGTGVGFSETTVFKLDPADLSTIDTYSVPVEEPARIAGDHERDVGATPSGAYNVLDRDDTFFMSIRKEQRLGIDAYADSVTGDRTSPIERVGRYEIPESELHQPDEEAFIGMTMTYDGRLAFCTSLGTVGVVDRALSADSATYLSLNGPDAPANAASGTDEVSNSIAVDETGGIYLVSSEKLYRIQWTGEELTLDPEAGAWVADYPTGSGTQAGRLGAGSGSTPSLMGVDDEDRFVVITDGREQMHLMLFWRDDIPDGWESPAGRDPRVAGETPVTFGRDDDATNSEQSVLVQGYGAVVVNNQQPDTLNALPAGTAKITRFLDNVPGVSPSGVQRFQWDADEQELTAVWARPDVSLPNGIPCMSSESGLMYDVGQQDGVWNLTALDWDTGEVAFRHELDPAIQHNSYYAGSEVGPGGSIYSGAAGTVMQFKPGDDDPTPDEAPVDDAQSVVDDAESRLTDGEGL
jgi:hypothetical protein